MSLGEDLCEVNSSISVEANTPNYKINPGIRRGFASLEFFPGQPLIAAFSFSSQGDMGTLGPIGYPGPKGMKVNRNLSLL